MTQSAIRTEAEIKQHQQAPVKHGAYAYRDRGVLEDTKRSRLAELSEIVQTRPGVLGLLQERCVRAIMMCEIIEGYIVNEKQQGADLEAIPILSKLPAYQNSAQRCIQTLLHELPEERMSANAELDHIQRVIDEDEHDKNTV